MSQKKKTKKPVIENPLRRVIVVGSPRTNGRCAALANLLFEACIEDCPNDEVYLVPVSELDLAGCTGCDWCREYAWGEAGEGDAAAEAGEGTVAAEATGGAGAAGGNAAAEAAGDAGGDAAAKATGAAGGNAAAKAATPAAAGAETVSSGQRCIQADDIAEVYPLIEDCDELVVVAPVYFAGPSSQLKALLDRMQPFYWNRALRDGKVRRRPLTLHVVGEGGDPWGYEPLVTCVSSAFGAAGFRLERVLDWVGKIDEAGEITAEATVLEGQSLQQTGTSAAQGQSPSRADAAVKQGQPSRCADDTAKKEQSSRQVKAKSHQG